MSTLNRQDFQIRGAKFFAERVEKMKKVAVFEILDSTYEIKDTLNAHIGAVSAPIRFYDVDSLDSAVGLFTAWHVNARAS